MSSAGNTAGRQHFDAAAVKGSIDIVKVAGEYVRLRRIGATGRYLGLCPFHQEKTPSFNVNQTRQFYKCFGCGAGGDAIEFTMRVEGLGFSQAVDLLGERSGVLAGRSWSVADRRAYAQLNAQADVLAQRLEDFADGLRIAAVRPLAVLGPVLFKFGVDPAEALAHLNRGAHLLHVAEPRDIADTWRFMRLKGPCCRRRTRRARAAGAGTR